MADNDAQDAAGRKPSDDDSENDRDLTIRDAIVRLLHPVTFTILLILTSVLLLIAANVLDWDAGQVLPNMANHEFARGLITYLFAVTTIGTSVVLVMAALTGKLVKDESYQRGKEILALLLGVFGTIVGFYFGSEAHADVKDMGQLSLSQPLLSDAAAAAGGTVHLTAFVSGGSAPYTYATATDARSELQYQKSVDTNGWIVVDVVIPGDATGQVPLRLGVKDSTGATVIKESVVTVRPPGKGP